MRRSIQATVRWCERDWEQRNSKPVQSKQNLLPAYLKLFSSLNLFSLLRLYKKQSMWMDFFFSSPLITAKLAVSCCSFIFSKHTWEWYHSFCMFPKMSNYSFKKYPIFKKKKILDKAQLFELKAVFSVFKLNPDLNYRFDNMASDCQF